MHSRAIAFCNLITLTCRDGGEEVITYNTGKLSWNNTELLNFSERIQFAVPTAHIPGRFSLFLWPRITLYYTFPSVKAALVHSCPAVLVMLLVLCGEAGVAVNSCLVALCFTKVNTFAELARPHGARNPVGNEASYRRKLWNPSCSKTLFSGRTHKARFCAIFTAFCGSRA